MSPFLTPWIISHAPARAFYSGRPVVVLGADGFIGYNVALALHALGAKLSVLSRRAETPLATLTRYVIKGDLRDPEVIERVVRDQAMVLDCVGLLSAAESNQDPLRSLEDECRTQLQLVSACAASPARPIFVLLSSRLVYGRPCYLPVDENHPLNPTSIYAAHKITVENYLKVFQHTHGLRVGIFRISNPYGPYQLATAKGYGVINQFLWRAAGGDAITIFGDGQQQRDYFYIDDLVNILLLGAMTESCYGETFNVGGRTAVSLAEAAHCIAQAAGDTPIDFVPWPQQQQQIETGDYRSNMDKLDTHLQLPAAISFSDGVARALAHYRDVRQHAGALHRAQ